MARRRVQDRMAECDVYIDDLGNRALKFWPGFQPSFQSPHLRRISHGWIFVLSEAEWAQRVIEVLAEPDSSSERELAMLRRMSTEDEWRQAEALNEAAKTEAASIRPTDGVV